MSVTNWVVDPLHSYIEYAINLNNQAPFKVYFRKMAGLLAIDDGLENAQLTLQWTLESLDTGDKGLDKFLTSTDFFASDKISAVKFSSDHISRLSETQFAIKGSLTYGENSVEVSFNSRFENNQVQQENGTRKTGLYMATQVSPDMFSINNRAISFDKSISIEIELEFVEKVVALAE